ncbi:flavin-containing monooxygenase 5-like isoform X1 [Argopecten irradians]|uniref:flavin-containing monooxygenase 5-like isoform X1 n=1 Tax=Argopecten irradians TaxID=31199 RepID=UPI00371D5BF8
MEIGSNPPVRKDVIIIGAGISGIAAAKCLHESGLDPIVLERTGDVGGLWTFRENDYGVMRFTHINVSKYNYCFSDFPFPEEMPDFPHNTDMAQYIRDYCTKFDVYQHIRFYHKVLTVERTGEEWKVKCQEVGEDGKTVKSINKPEIFISKFLAIATGHHAKPSLPNFPGMDSFKGEAIHAVNFNDALSNGMVGKRVLVVGIGNSAVDAAVNCASVGRCKSVYISSRSGAWVFSNYVLGFPADLYACRVFLKLPWKLATYILELIIKLISGNPKKWNLNPKMHALQTQPTVSPTLIHHIQRREVKVVPNIQRIENNEVFFMNGEHAEFDHIIYCTGYKVDLPFLSDDLQKLVLDKDTNAVKLYKSVFNPDIGPSLAFIGFVQPASGGVLSMSETQSRWFAELCKGKVKLPSKSDMFDSMKSEKESVSSRYYHSPRHTLQKDPVIYNDEIAGFIGAKPTFLQNPRLFWHLLWSSCGSYQWRLQGPHAWSGATEAVRKVPITDFMNLFGVVVFGIIAFILYKVCFASECCSH